MKLLYLRKPDQTDLEVVKSLYENSIGLHKPWTFVPIDYQAYLFDHGRYFLCLQSSNEIVGTFCISGIVRGLFQSAYLGYEIFVPHENKGFMRVGLKLMIDQAFGVLNLHRLEANIQPENIASIKLVAGAGFIKEGFSKQYLNIGGKGWQDHERWAIVNDNWREI